MLPAYQIEIREADLQKILGYCRMIPVGGVSNQKFVRPFAKDIGLFPDNPGSGRIKIMNCEVNCKGFL